MHRNSHLAMNSRTSRNCTVRLRGLRTTLAGQIELNRPGRSYGYARADLVQSDLAIAPDLRFALNSALWCNLGASSLSDFG